MKHSASLHQSILYIATYELCCPAQWAPRVVQWAIILHSIPRMRKIMREVWYHLTAVQETIGKAIQSTAASCALFPILNHPTIGKLIPPQTAQVLKRLCPRKTNAPQYVR